MQSGLLIKNQKIIDLKLLYVELESSVYYDSSKISNINDLKSKIISSLESYSKSVDLNKFGGRFRYSKVLQIIDNVDSSITSNITNVKIRRNLNCAINVFSQYELCFGNAFRKLLGEYNIKSTGFNILGESNSKETAKYLKVTVGTVDYKTGEILINTIYITGTELPNNVVEIEARPDSNDVIGLNDLYISFDVSKSIINMLKDTVVSGEQISGKNFPLTSSYSSGKITR